MNPLPSFDHEGTRPHASATSSPGRITAIGCDGATLNRGRSKSEPAGRSIRSERVLGEEDCTNRPHIGRTSLKMGLAYDTRCFERLALPRAFLPGGGP